VCTDNDQGPNREVTGRKFIVNTIGEEEAVLVVWYLTCVLLLELPRDLVDRLGTSLRVIVGVWGGILRRLLGSLGHLLWAYNCQNKVQRSLQDTCRLSWNWSRSKSGIAFFAESLDWKRTLLLPRGWNYLAYLGYHVLILLELVQAHWIVLGSLAIELVQKVDAGKVGDIVNTKTFGK
jgi:hypothetical protein